MSLDISLKRRNKTYLPGDKIAGFVIVDAYKPLSHNGIKLFVEGLISIATITGASGKNVSSWESLVRYIKPVKLIDFSMDICAAGKLPDGRTELPFEFVLKVAYAAPDAIAQYLVETYHGYYISVRYKITASMSYSSGLLFGTKEVKTQLEFFVQVPGQGLDKTTPALPTPKGGHLPKPLSFEMTPAKLRNVRKYLITYVPDYYIDVSIDSMECDVSRAFTGSITVRNSAAELKSVELYLVRVETCLASDSSTPIKEATEIYNLHVVEGNPCRDLALPLYMPFPRRFTSPTILTKNYRAEFEINIIIYFADGHYVTENCKLQLYRSPAQSAPV